MKQRACKQIPAPLPFLDRTLLRLAGSVVPPAERAEWFRSWHAEVWHRRHCNAPSSMLTDLSIGLVRDALWLRTENWRRLLEGTAIACLASLLLLILLSALFGLAYAGHWQALGTYLGGPFKRFLVAAPVVLFVSFAHAPRRHTNVPREEAAASGASRTMRWLKRKSFFIAKTALILVLAFLLSADMFQPVYPLWSATTELLQVFFFVLLAIGALRWVFRDQEERCKHCLRSLAAPARVGRPSHNLLEWNGTELICKHGHGVLSVPEMETSWCASSRWVAATADGTRPRAFFLDKKASTPIGSQFRTPF